MVEDAVLGTYQRCVIQDDRLVRLILFGDTSLFADWRDLVANGIELDDKRKMLLRPAGEVKQVEGKLVCCCNQIGQTTIERAIKEQNAADSRELKSVCGATRAKTSCGSCRRAVQKLIPALMMAS